MLTCHVPPTWVYTTELRDEFWSDFSTVDCIDATENLPLGGALTYGKEPVHHFGHVARSMQEHFDRAPAQSTGTGPAVAAPVAAPGQGCTSRRSNLDATGRAIVRKGCTVSYGGLRLRVARVRMGHFIGHKLGISGAELAGATDVYACSLAVVL